MDDTRELLSTITVLRQRLHQAQGLVSESGAALATLVSDAGKPASGLGKLERQVAMANAHATAFDEPLRRLGAVPTGCDEPLCPRQLTARTHRALTLTRDSLMRLRRLANEPMIWVNDTGPLAILYGDALVLVESVVLMIQAFPDSTTTQLRLCHGLEAMLAVISERLAAIETTLVQHRTEHDRLTRLTELFRQVRAHTVHSLEPFEVLAEAIANDVDEGAPLRFIEPDWTDTTRFASGHGLMVAQVVARQVRLDPELRDQRKEAVVAALLHDIGMLDIPAAVLAHPGPLDTDQRRQVEAHTTRGADVVSRLNPASSWLVEAVAGHHERLDGTGYPAGLSGRQLGSFTRLLAVCDVYTSLCTARPHRPAFEARAALTDTLLLAEQGVLDQIHAERLLHLSFYPVGSVVELADGQIGLVVATHSGRRDLNLPSRPVIALVADSRGRVLSIPRHLDLAQCEGHSIVRSLSATERRRVLGVHYPSWL